jgi:hypothetical protein
MIVIVLPVYEIFGISPAFWIAIAACLCLAIGIYAIYLRLYAFTGCPRCHFKMTNLQMKQVDRCPRCGALFSAKS